MGEMEPQLDISLCQMKTSVLGMSYISLNCWKGAPWEYQMTHAITKAIVLSKLRARLY